jgi:hypothetical protein
MLLQKVNKRPVLFNNILKSGNIENLHTLKFDFSQHEQGWRISPSTKRVGVFGRALLWIFRISILTAMAIFVLRSHA